MELVAKKRVEFQSAFGGQPGFGIIGQKIEVYVNHYPVTLPKHGFIYHYDIDLKEVKQPPKNDQKKTKKITPANDAMQQAVGRIHKLLKRKTIMLWQAQEQGFFGTTRGVYDGERNFYTAKKLLLADGQEREFPVVVPADVEEMRREKNFSLTVKLVAELDTANLHRAIENPDAAVFPVHILGALQCVMREALWQWCPSPGMRSFYFPEGAFDLGSHRAWSPKMAWPGIFMSLRPNLWKVTLNLDVSHTAMSKELLFLEFYGEYMRMAARGVDVRNFDQYWNIPAVVFERAFTAARGLIYGLRVQSSHSGIRRWRCIGMSDEPLNTLDFALDNGTRQRVVDYFAEKYGITLQYQHLPAVMVGPAARPKYLPMTHCKILPGQKMGSKLAEEEVAMMVSKCSTPPDERWPKIEDIRSKPITTKNGEKKLVFEPSDNMYMEQFGISIAKQMLLTPARILPFPSVVDNRNCLDVNTEKATFNVPRGLKLVPLKCVPLTAEWAVINMAPRVIDRNALVEFIDLLCRVGRERMPPFPYPKNIDSIANDIDRNSFVKYYEHLKKTFFGAERPQLLLVIVPKKGCPEYGACKQYFDVQEGVKTQMVAGDSLKKNLERGLPMYVSNLLLKINAKLNGSNQKVAYKALNSKKVEVWTPQVEHLKFLQRLVSSPTMMFGADVTHPSPGVETAPSIAAVTASVDRAFCEYRARVRAQAHREEIIQNMEEMAIELLNEFKKIHNCFPHHIVFFRDGVSEGQMRAVWTNELLALRGACRKIGLENIGKPGITYIVVGKRHHTRFFPENGKGNVAPGTIVDRSVCHYSELDWYLTSHFAIKGTARPAHYHVLYDDNNFDVDSLQVLSHNMCSVFQRCLRTVSMPAPAYYAHLAAFRARHHLSSLNLGPNATLNDYNRHILPRNDVLDTQYFC